MNIIYHIYYVYYFDLLLIFFFFFFISAWNRCLPLTNAENYARHDCIRQGKESFYYAYASYATCCCCFISRVF